MNISEVKVSIIVPIYNVEEYLSECLESLANQTLNEIEVIMVNDGSTDGSFEIAKNYEQKHDNFYLYNKPNGGLGQARNFGINYAKGEYLAFVDSDDYLTIDAYEKLFSLAKMNNCDIVSGNVVRFNSKRTYKSKLHSQGQFNKTKLNTTMIETPELIYDVTTWNKIYKYTFWEKNKFLFPEGIIYEDIPVTIPAHYLSSSTAILSDVIYYWRERDGITRSLSQQNDNILNFLDRLKVLKMVDNFFENNVIEPKLHQLKNFRWLHHDFNLFINILDTVGEDYRKEIISRIQTYITCIPQEVFNLLSPIDRLKYYYIKSGDLESLVSAVKYSKIEGINNVAVSKDGNKFYAFTPFEIPKSELEISSYLKNSIVNRKVDSVYWDNNILKIKGYAFKTLLSMSNKKKIKLSAFAVNCDTLIKYPLSVHIDKRKDVTFKNGGKISNKFLMKRLHNYDWSGFTIDVDVTILPIGNYEILVYVNNEDFNYEFRVGGPVKGNKARPSSHVFNNSRVSPEYNAGWDLTLCIEELSSMLTHYEVKNNKLKLYGWTKYDLKDTQLSFNDWNNNIFKNNPLQPIDKRTKNCNFKNLPADCNTFYCTINLQKIEKLNKPMEWYFNIRCNSIRYTLDVASNLIDKLIIRNTMEMYISKSAKGTFYIKYTLKNNYLNDIKWQQDKLLISVHSNTNIFNNNLINNIDQLSLVAKDRGTGQQVYFLTKNKTFVNKFIKLDFCIPMVDSSNDSIFTFGTWDFYVEFSFKSGEIIKKRLAVTDKLKLSTYRNKTHKYQPVVTENGNLSLRVNLVRKWYEDGPRRLGFIEKIIYPLFRKFPIKNNRVVFESYWGKNYSCNPRYLYEYLNDYHPEYECIWLLQDESTKIKGQGKRVRINSLKYYFYLASSKYFVNNVNFPLHYKKRKGSIEIQTMHGTPLKTLGLDVPHDFKKPGSKEQFLYKCNRWDYLISPSDYVSNIAKRCFEYKNDILEIGTPRMDYLIQNNNTDKINKIKQKMNIPSSKKVILYAPTWRLKNSFEIKLDLDEMRKRLSNEYVLIIRLHHYAVSTLNGGIFNEFVINGSENSDIQELLLISDILITDYSSVMFDFAILNRPILFYTYDYELYEKNLRGFYFDFKNESPTPLLQSSSEVINAIENIDDFTLSSSEKFIQFREKYCQYETGNSCKEIISKVFK